MFILPEKTSNIYEIIPHDYEKLIMEIITKIYQKVPDILEKSNQHGNQKHRQDIKISRKNRSPTKSRNFYNFKRSQRQLLQQTIMSFN